MYTLVYRGDTGKFRQALAAAGFAGSATRTIFNDHAKVRGYRRLKLWMAAALLEAPQAKQEKLVNELKKEFGDRFISCYLQKTAPYNSFSFCVRVKPF